MMTNDDERGEGGKKCPKFDDVICERPLILETRDRVSCTSMVEFCFSWLNTMSHDQPSSDSYPTKSKAKYV